jgi:Uma2 family endonuclease
VKILTTDPPPEVMDEVLARRKALGQDRMDEVWEGVYHMAPLPYPWHAVIQAQLIALLTPAARRQGWVALGPFNLGEEDNYRCPDAGVVETVPVDLYMPTALVVVEIVSPNDETFAKFDFYWDHQVEELLTIERPQKVTWWERRSDYRPKAESDLLGLHAEVLIDQIIWP